jgi:anti-sigma factor RsiW
MTHCVDEGRLRAYLDGELPAMECGAVGAHIAGCAACQGQLERQRALAAQVRALLSAPPAPPDPRAALAQLRLADQHPTIPSTTWFPSISRGRAGNDQRSRVQTFERSDGQTTNDQPSNVQTFERSDIQRSTFMQLVSVWSSRRRSLLAALAALVAVLSLLALPPVRAAADDLLSIFRVQKVVFLPVDPARIQQLANLNFDKNTLFVTKPTAHSPTPPRAVASAAEAASAIGYTVEQPNTFPSAPLTTAFTVSEPSKMTFQINVAAARQVLELMSIDDVTIPDALGAGPIKVDVPALASVHYHGLNYDMTLNQGHSPNVALPEGVDLAQLGKAALRLLGMTPEQAEATSQGINWNNTLLFPFPKDTSNIREVTINGENGLLVSGGARGEQHWQLYWQHGDKLYMLEATGSLRDNEMAAQMIATAESVQ